MKGITYRITGLMFLLIAATVLGLTSLANWQMSNRFEDYLITSYEHGQMMGHVGMGLPEHSFLSSVHQALIWVGLVILIVGLAASYVLARGITIPLLKLNAAVQEIAKGNYSQRVTASSDDEVGQLANAFNRMAEALEANNLLRRQLLADIAHELRTPLAVVQGNLEGMLDGVIHSDKEQLGSLHEETVHLGHLISDLRDLSLAEAGQLSLDKNLTDIDQIISRAVSMLLPLADEKNIALEYLPQPAPLIEVDAGRISQVLYNLMINAIRYTPETGRISLTTGMGSEGGQEWLKVSVCDSGAGIDPSDLPYIFDHFYRADKSRARRSGGSGIGLSIVKQLVESHGGRVNVESKLGEGSCFTIYLPVAPTIDDRP